MEKQFLIIYQNLLFSLFFDLLSFLIYSNLSYFQWLVLFCTMGKEIGCFKKINQSELSTKRLKKPVLSYSASHLSSASNSTRTSISYRLDNRQININQNKNNISNTDDIHSCVTPQKKLQCSGHI